MTLSPSKGNYILLPVLQAPLTMPHQCCRAPQVHQITEHPELEESHKDHWVQPASPHSTIQKSKPPVWEQCLNALWGPCPLPLGQNISLTPHPTLPTAPCQSLGLRCYKQRAELIVAPPQSVRSCRARRVCRAMKGCRATRSCSRHEPSPQPPLLWSQQTQGPQLTPYPLPSRSFAIFSALLWMLSNITSTYISFKSRSETSFISSE